MVPSSNLNISIKISLREDSVKAFGAEEFSALQFRGDALCFKKFCLMLPPQWPLTWVSLPLNAHAETTKSHPWTTCKSLCVCQRSLWNYKMCILGLKFLGKSLFLPPLTSILPLIPFLEGCPATFLWLLFIFPHTAHFLDPNRTFQGLGALRLWVIHKLIGMRDGLTALSPQYLPVEALTPGGWDWSIWRWSE